MRNICSRSCIVRPFGTITATYGVALPQPFHVSIYRSICVLTLCFLFFFQAEDGIRDVAVTGVQTCALPISTRRRGRLRLQRRRGGCRRARQRRPPSLLGSSHVLELRHGSARAHADPVFEIGRASCRERV